MKLGLTAALMTMEKRGLEGWSAAAYSGLEAVCARPSRHLILLNKQFLDTAELEEIVTAVWHCRLDVEHPGYSATCKGCGVMYYRSKPATAVHYCLACGPVTGRLEFE